MQIHKKYFKKRIYRRFPEELRSLKKHLELTELLNQWELEYKVYRLQRLKERKFGTPMIEWYGRCIKKNID